MKKGYLVLTVSLLFASFSAKAQHDLVLNIKGIKSDKGDIRYALYTDQDSFLSMEKVFKAGAQKANKGNISVNIKDLPDGRYAIAIYHDENGNEKLDTNMLGIPKEDVAFSIGKMKTFGPPKFEECAFNFTSDMELDIKFE